MPMRMARTSPVGAASLARLQVTALGINLCADQDDPDVTVVSSLVPESIADQSGVLCRRARTLSPYTLRVAPCALRLTPCALRVAPYPLRLTPRALPLTPYTLRVAPYRLTPCPLSYGGRPAGTAPSRTRTHPFAVLPPTHSPIRLCSPRACAAAVTRSSLSTAASRRVCRLRPTCCGRRRGAPGGFSTRTLRFWVAMVTLVGSGSPAALLRCWLPSHHRSHRHFRAAAYRSPQASGCSHTPAHTL
eukprot:6345976-Prymnesium_polylepis.1